MTHFCMEPEINFVYFIRLWWIALHWLFAYSSCNGILCRLAVTFSFCFISMHHLLRTLKIWSNSKGLKNFLTWKVILTCLTNFYFLSREPAAKCQHMVQLFVGKDCLCWAHLRTNLPTLTKFVVSVLTS